MADSVNSKTDVYGFERPEDFDYQTYEDFMAGYLSVLARRASKWTNVNIGKNSLTRSRKLKRYIRKGIPSEHRPVVWMVACGADKKMEAYPGLYQQMLNESHDPELVENITKDVPRTFPENIYFQDTPSDPNAKQRPLYNVLLALGQKNKQVGYCQGLNFIAGLLLLIVKDEQKVFWLMDTILNDLLPDYYTPAMTGAMVDQEVMGELVKKKVPDVAAKFDKEGVAWSLVSSKWFLCLYADVLPVETVLRIWDCVFNEGAKVLFRVAVTLVKRNREKIVACKNFPEIVRCFKQIPTDPMVVHCHQFMQSIFTEPGSFPSATIQTHRDECLSRVG